MAERAAKQLALHKSELPNSIIEVIATLARAGFEAFIVGGGVRDTLLGLKPKDFDAVTDAKPHEVKDVFGKRCRIIGRRFQLAHVYSGRDLIEVATFRAPPKNDANITQDGMLIRDNVWGDIKQDFARRDFSINALYYQPLTGVVHDFCGAIDDINHKIIRLLGDAQTRIEEDPVRLLRALRFKAKLGFEFDEALARQFRPENWALLEQISPHRLYDETQKMFTGGYLVPLLPLLFESGAIAHLVIYPPKAPSPLVQQVAVNTDKRIKAGKSINPAFFYAALLWENYLYQLEKFKKRNMPFSEAQLQAASIVIDRQRIKTAIPKFAEQFIRDIWLLQPRLAAPKAKQIEGLAEHPRFRAGFDFLLLREECGDSDHPLSESTNGMGEWWQNFQTLSDKQKQQAISSFDDSRRSSQKRSRNRNRQKQTEIAENIVTSVEVKSGTTAAGVTTKTAKSAANQQPSVQDKSELNQLHKLALPPQNRSNHPKPLFVIEHQSVVPPLQKSLNGKKHPLPNAQAETQSENHQDNDHKAPQPENALTTKNNRQNDQPRYSATAPKPAPTSNAIPSQRRRRVPSSDVPAARVKTNKLRVIIKSLPEAKTAQPLPVEKNTEKPVKKAVDNSSAAIDKTKNDRSNQTDAKTANSKSATRADAKSNTGKGAIPATRRRRAPSSDEPAARTKKKRGAS
ncbi:polynucleotide adenylyltransferase PcnB [Psychrobacter ciconiae]|uniref:polynucleotide adenylyltransferase PcnB n=1 Tax=Psychrobacter ciconiae TaxID=1553449 RepID=UPI00191A7ED1|nr:polynucleotide adenylyltransferase PcnB [Psychrobacter ciconiae]